MTTDSLSTSASSPLTPVLPSFISCPKNRSSPPVVAPTLASVNEESQSDFEEIDMDEEVEVVPQLAPTAAR
jgi:hypothetical protein